MPDHQKSLFETDAAPWEIDDANEVCAATVVFAEPPFGPFDYRVPADLQKFTHPGKRVRAPLGRGNRKMIGYCVEVGHRDTSGRRLKDIQGVLDETPLLSPSMLRMTKWMAEHYLSHWGQAIEAVAPAAVRSKAGTREMTYLTAPVEVAARMTQLKLPPKQSHALKILAASSQPLTPQQLAAAAGCTLAPITQLRKKKLVREEIRRTGVKEHDVPAEVREQHLELNEDQIPALAAILEPLNAPRHETLLLHGVTGSGKTEVYIRAIDEVIQFGRQAIVLVPEISLTPQTRQRFRSRFPRVAVLHSHLSSSERHYHWLKIASGETQVVVGARSAVFAPTKHLGLIILDEEHDASFKQDTAPRYHARDVALHRAREENVPLVLGSATPSLESYRAAKTGEFKLIEMLNRVGGRPLPDVRAIDMRHEYREGLGGGAISRQLAVAMKDAIKAGGQIILLLNRRGFATNIQCPRCGLAVRCPDCDIALTHHREHNLAICHYCDHQINAPPICPDCGFEGIRYAGIGTQRLEAEVKGRFPEAECLRMDSDSMQKPGSHEEALGRFRRGEIDILLGTQMIAKGLDFPNVTLVGVVNADSALHFPDFRAAERTFQLVTQVAGRTGRGEKSGRVLVQSYTPEHPAIEAALRHDYLQFVTHELPIREEYGYPPYDKMIRLIVRGAHQELTEQFTESLADRMRDAIEKEGLNATVLGPAPAPISKLRGKFRYHALLQGPNGDVLRQIAKQIDADIKPSEEVQWVFDVDPLALL